MIPTPYYSIPQLSSDIQFKRNRSIMVWIVLSVLFIHVSGLWLISFSSTPKVAPKSKIVVKTVQLHPKTQTLNPIAPVQPQEKQVISPEKQAPAIPKVEPQPEPKLEAKVEPKPQAPVAAPVKKEEVAAKTAPKVEEKPQIKPESKKEKPKNPATTPKKTQTPPKEEKKSAPKTPEKVTSPPKPAPKKTEAKPAKKTTAQAPVKKPATESKPKPKAKQEPTAEEIAAKEAEKAKERELAAAKAVTQERLSNLSATMAKVGESSSKINSVKVSSIDQTAIPQQIGTLQIDALPVGTNIPVELSAKEASYRDHVATRLKQALKLPDYGSVKIKLTLNRSGTVAGVTIISSESEQNKQYIERSVTSLIFPKFENRFGDAAQYTFLITLNNDH